MEDTSFPWNKITLKEALFLDETTLTHCLYAIHDQVNWLYIGQSRRLVTRLYQHLGIATGRASTSASGERLLDPDEALNLLTHDYIPTDPRDFFWYLDERCAVYDGAPIQDLGLAIMSNRPQCLEWGYYYVSIQQLYPNAEGRALDELLYSEEKKLIMRHKPLFNKQHNEQRRENRGYVRRENMTFDSDLDIQYVTFFDALGIAWEYKPGYMLLEQQYRPSFRLPDLHCIVEIKEKELTEKEEETARLLTLISGNPVHVFFGSPRLPDHHPLYSKTYSEFYLCAISNESSHSFFSMEDCDEEERVLWHDLQKYDVSLRMWKDRHLHIETPDDLHPDILLHLHTWIQVCKERLMKTLEKYSNERSKKTYSTRWQNNTRWQLVYQLGSTCLWSECPSCHEYGIYSSSMLGGFNASRICTCAIPPMLVCDSAQLQNAYSLARERKS